MKIPSLGLSGLVDINCGYPWGGIVDCAHACRRQLTWVVTHKSVNGCSPILLDVQVL
jgi:hypothetical protein